MIVDKLKSGALLVLLVLCAVLAGLVWLGSERLGIAEGQRDVAQAGLDALRDAVVKQKADAADALASANASVLAQQERLDAAALVQKANDEKSVVVVDGLRADLRAARLRITAETARRGGGGAAEQGGDPIAALVGAGGGANASGVLSDPEAEADNDAYLADRINLAFASCKAYALKLREVVGN